MNFAEITEMYEKRVILLGKYNICLPLKPFHRGSLTRQPSAATSVEEMPDSQAFA